MANYQVSLLTRTKLIEAAGELFAEHGVDRVTTREIAAKAGMVQNSIRYHFGSISGLIEAVWEKVLNEWQTSRFEDLIHSREQLLKEKKGQALLVEECIRLIFDIIYQPKQPLWISKFLVRSAMSPEGRNKIATRVSGSVVPALIDLYMKITGSGDHDAAKCWGLRILAAPIVFTSGITEFVRFREGGTINKKLYCKLEEVTIRDALFAAGLASEI